MISCKWAEVSVTFKKRKGHSCLREILLYANPAILQPATPWDTGVMLCSSPLARGRGICSVPQAPEEDSRETEHQLTQVKMRCSLGLKPCCSSSPPGWDSARDSDMLETVRAWPHPHMLLLSPLLIQLCPSPSATHTGTHLHILTHTQAQCIQGSHVHMWEHVCTFSHSFAHVQCIHAQTHAYIYMGTEMHTQGLHTHILTHMHIGTYLHIVATTRTIIPMH